ncbi:fidgetin-like [Pristis pectinata]|uniref:fidgetin-like n=1 Tax=Pristis pectinata TaxID=685728 RepID=UPI00223CAA2A|nr:fidgetin-like [Pristis pectinata]
MHWTPEHAQGTEQYLDISFTMSSLAHKIEENHLTQQQSRYEWANDDISALTASNLLKKYAEKYSGIVNSSCERPELNPYIDAPLGPINEQKNENDAWQMSLREQGTFSMNSIDDGLAGSKARTNSTLPPGSGSVGIGSSSVVTSSLSEPCYPSNTSGPISASRIQSCLVPIGTSQECSSGYSATYSPSDYLNQATSAVPSSLTASLNSSGLLQPVHPMPTIVPSYNSSLAGVNSIYNSPSNHYPSQSSTGPGCSGVHLPSLGTPIHLPSSSRHSIVPRYTYRSHSLNKDSLSPVTNGSNGALKRKAFDITPKEDEGMSRYSYGQQRIASGLYQMPNDVALDECQGNHFGRNGDTLPVEFKSRKQRIVNDLIDKYSDHDKKRVPSPPYNSEQLLRQSRSCEAFVKFTPALLDGEVVSEQDCILPHQLQAQRAEAVTASNQLEEQLKSLDSQLISLVTNEIVDSSPPVQWGDIAGLDTAKAVIEQQVLWPLLRPEAYSGGNGAPKSILLFGPRGGGKTMLTRCIATHLGATFLKVSGSSFISKWKGDGEMILQAMFLIARSRQPSVIFINELDVMLSNPVGKESIHLNSIKAKLLSHVEGVVNSSSDHIIVIGGTRHPDDIEETIHRYFIKRLYISPPDSIARRQILIYTLSQQDHCLSDGEISLIVQNTEGYSGSDLMQLCREAALEQGDGQLKAATYKDFENAFCKVRPSVSQKELKLYTEWSKSFGSCV